MLPAWLFRGHYTRISFQSRDCKERLSPHISEADAATDFALLDDLARSSPVL